MLGLALLTACQPTSPTPVIGYINAKKVMQQYHGTATHRQVIEQQALRWQRSLDSLTSALHQQQLPPAQQTTQVGHYRELLQQRVRQAGEAADQQLIQEVNAYLKQFGAQHHYTFILGATESGNIVYADSANDVTARVIVGLNQQYDHQRRPSR
ncbi:OmpH family outer membrane protein [Hymenobacter sp. BRD67]|uniref:OmpH family outer membrane protein n=1 Tax=Hymenobacter sp. BRD67 TaxID=2675877 RepID=UPI0015677F48|nr:OmpH family outer membrane protein [Hymenobacter sp. BRD67]QKG55118.1 OmpH family outer membrane protein [Hymenobacter sp. BRD67]